VENIWREQGIIHIPKTVGKPEDYKTVQDLGHLTMAHVRQVTRFESDLYLINFSCAQISEIQQQRSGHDDNRFHNELVMLQDWRFVGAEHGAIVIMDFRITLNDIKAICERQLSIELRAKINFDLFNRADKEFVDNFPQFKDVRVAVAHPELTRASWAPAEQWPSNTWNPFRECGQVKLSGPAIIDGKLVFVLNGNIVSYDLSPASLETLKKIKYDVYDAVSPVSE
jgi:hypothetical protein